MLNINIISGTERQIDWAQDILNRPVTWWENCIEADQRHPYPNETKLNAYHKATDAYSKWITEDAEEKGGLTADWVIDHRFYIEETANDFFRLESKAAAEALGIRWADLQEVKFGSRRRMW